MRDTPIKRIMITGGAGFIGSHLVRNILDGVYAELVDAHVVVVDLLTYAGNVDNLPSSSHKSRLTFAHEDVCDSRRIEPLMRDCDVVIHLAAESHVDRSITGWAHEFVTTNVLGTQVLLDLARRCGVRRFVHVSTDEVYGSIKLGRYTETAPLNPSSPYSASKAGAEHIVSAYAHTHNLDAVITRGANTYGPNQYPEKLIPRFITRLLSNHTVPLYGDGRHVRSWLHVSDHCHGIVRALTRGKTGQAYNIRGTSELSNRQLTELLVKLCDVDRDRITYVADRPGHDYRYAISGAKSYDELGYEPTVELEHGLRSTIHWYREHRDAWLPIAEADWRHDEHTKS